MAFNLEEYAANMRSMHRTQIERIVNLLRDQATFFSRQEARLNEAPPHPIFTQVYAEAVEYRRSVEQAIAILEARLKAGRG